MSSFEEVWDGLRFTKEKAPFFYSPHNISGIRPGFSKSKEEIRILMLKINAFMHFLRLKINEFMHFLRLKVNAFLYLLRLKVNAFLHFLRLKMHF